MENLELFLKELTKLSQKYGLKIGGCGCCNSPFIEDFNGKYVMGDLLYDKEKGKYIEG